MNIMMGLTLYVLPTIVSFTD